MWYPYTFEAQIVHHDLGTYRYTVVFLDDEIAASLPFHDQPRLRISGELADVPLKGAWQPSRGRWYLMLGKPLLKAANKGVGDTVEVRFRLEDPDILDMPAALSAALDAAPAQRAVFDLQTIGKQRALCHRVASARTGDTTIRRVAEVMDALSGRDVPGFSRLRLVIPEPVSIP